MNELSNLSSESLSDALDSLNIKGVLMNLKPLQQGEVIYGPAYTVQFHNEKHYVSNKPIKTYIDLVPKGSILVIDNNGREDCTVWGEILTEMALIRGIKGTVINGMCRDKTAILNKTYPVFTKGFHMRSGKGRVYISGIQQRLEIDSVSVSPNDIVFADSSGVVIIPLSHLNPVIERAKQIKQTEQKILQAIKNKPSLKEARKQHLYETPWLPQECRES